MWVQHLRYSCLWLSILFSITLSAQEITVLDENDDPLIGVHVYNGDNVSVTDIEGKTALVVTDQITLEYLGYKKAILTKAELIASDYICRMLPDDEILEEIIIIGRTDARELDLPYNVARIKSEEIFSSNAQTSADALSLNSGAYVQKSQLGGGSPILRGFEANKVLLVVDGVRMNNAIYRNGHLQNAITIDPAILDQMEIIYGAGSLLYGSEALGGVIHFRTRTPLLDFSEGLSSAHKLNAYLRHNTADQEITAHLDHSYSSQKFGAITSISFSDRSDLRMGSVRSDEYPTFGLRSEYIDPDNNDQLITNPDPNIQRGTGYAQLDLFQKLLWRPSDIIKTELNLQYSTSSNIPRYDNLTQRRNGLLRFAEWNYGPQQRLLIAPKLSWTSSSKLFDKATVITSFQDISESRITRQVAEPDWEVQEEKVKVLGLTIDFNKRLTKKQKLTYGVDVHYNDVRSRASIGNYQVLPAEVPVSEKTLSRYPSAGSQLRNMGIYLQHNWQNKDSTLVWINGIRYSNQKTDLLYDRADPFAWPAYFYDGITSTNEAVVGITGLNYQYGSWLAKASTGTAFRSPNVDDLAKIRVNGDEITVPNPELNSEKVWNSELTLGYRSRPFTFGITGFYTQLTDAIIRENFTLPDGRSEYIVANDTLTVTANVNANSGWIRGLSFQLALQPTAELKLNSSISFQKGRAISKDKLESPLGHIPPTYGRTSLSYTLPRIQLTADWRFNAWKPIEEYGGSVDNPDLGAIDRDGNEVGAPGWQTFGISTQAELGRGLTLNLALENILDQHYRPFASGVSSAGRHVVCALRYKMQ